MPAPAASITVASLDADSIPDAAIIADGELLVLHGKNTLTGGGRLETLPVDRAGEQSLLCRAARKPRCREQVFRPFANNDASDNTAAGTSDTIMVPGGTYNLTWQAGVFDANGNALTHLDVIGPFTVIGDTVTTTIIDGKTNDEVFTINGGPVASTITNPSGASFVFDVMLENLTVQNGKNNSVSGSNGAGGCINWDAFGNGNLNITNSVIQD